jgi:hypothetical protein
MSGTTKDDAPTPRAGQEPSTTSGGAEKEAQQTQRSEAEKARDKLPPETGGRTNSSA